MTFTFKYTKADFVKALRSHMWRTGSWLGLIFGIAIIGFAIWLYWRNAVITALEIELAFFGVILLLMPWLLPYYFANKSYKAISHEQTLSFLEDHIYMKSPVSEVNLKWEFYKSAYETQDLFLIYIANQPRMFTVLPKRLFKNGSELLEFRMLLQSKGLINAKAK